MMDRMSQGLALALVLSVGLSQAASVWTVYPTAHVPEKDGAAVGEVEMTGVQQLTNAIEQAADKDAIIIKSGVYDLAAELTPGNPVGDSKGVSYLFVRNKTLTFKGEDTTPWAQKSADQGAVLKGGPDGRILYGYAGGGRGCVFKNLTFDGGHAQADREGGAIYFLGAEFEGYATNCIFRNCSADVGGATYYVNAFDCCYSNNWARYGGAAFGHRSSRSSGIVYTNRFVGCTFVGNEAKTSSNGGGALYFDLQGPVIGCTFTNNVATAGTGGAIAAADRGPDSIISNCTFVGNSSLKSGGAVNYCGNIYDSVFVGNTALGESGAAGGAVASGGDVYRCAFVDNHSWSSGGGLYNAGYSTYDCVFTNNSSKSLAGGLRSNGACVGCTFVGNRASGANGGAFHSQAALAGVTNSVFINNTCPNGNGGAVSASQALSLSGCTFDGNTAGANGGSAWCTTAEEIAGCTFKNGKATKVSGGVCIETFSGLVRDCTFESNTNRVDKTYPGSHLSKAVKVEGCTFTGYGDVYARDFERCVFNECRYPFLTGNVRAFLSFDRDGTGDGTLRNCLFVSNRVNHVMASAGVVTRFENCTFAENVTPYDGCTFWAFRDGGSATASDGIPSTNVLVNCIFANGVKLAQDGTAQPGDLSFYRTGTYVPAPSQNIASNCVYGARGKGYKTYSYWVEESLSADVVEAPTRFVKDLPTPPEGDWPAHMIARRRQAALGAGQWLDWMSDATDLAGHDMPTSGAVDLGCYQCLLPPSGMYLFIR